MPIKTRKQHAMIVNLDNAFFIRRFAINNSNRVYYCERLTDNTHKATVVMKCDWGSTITMSSIYDNEVEIGDIYPNGDVKFADGHFSHQVCEEKEVKL